MLIRTACSLFQVLLAAHALAEEPPKVDLNNLQPYDDLRAIVLAWGGNNLAAADLRHSGDVLPLTEFDTDTPWPPEDKLPKGFDPNVIIEFGKNPGLGVRTLHQQGLTGKGVHVAIIDQPLIEGHLEYDGKIVSYKMIDCEGVRPQMHGPAVASLLVGKTCGVAPGAKLHFWAEPSWKGDYAQRTQALREILAYNLQAPREQRIRVVSVSVGFNPQRPNLDRWKNALADAEQSGLIVMHCSWHMHGACCPLEKNPERPESYEQCRFLPNRKVNRPWLKDHVCAPIDNRTFAGWMHDEQYSFSPKSGLSWAAPYLAGVLALGYQIDPDADPQVLLKLLHDTGTDFVHGGKLVNPPAFVAAVKELKEKREKVSIDG